MTDPLNAQAVKEIIAASGEASAAAAVRKFVQDYPHFAAPQQPPKPETPTYVKWGAGVAATIVAAAIIWMATTLNNLQLTVARIDERQQTDTTRQDIRDLQDRVGKLERAATSEDPVRAR